MITILGIAGWSGSGKTTLVERLVPVLTARGLRVATVKGSHHQPDWPGTAERAAGAVETLVAGAGTWVLARDAAGSLETLLPRLAPADLVLAEGFKTGSHAKLEVFRPALGHPPLFAADPRIIAVASDQPLTAPVPVVDLNDIAAVAETVLRWLAPCRRQGFSRRP